MSIENDKALYKSEFERNPHDAYYTEHWVTRALTKHLPAYLWEGYVWEPAAGRGDITEVLEQEKLRVLSSDLYPQAETIFEQDFLTAKLPHKRTRGIITNPPFGKIDGSKEPLSLLFTEKALQMTEFVAMLLRSEFNHGRKYNHLFTKAPFAYEIVLTSRPRWDDWWNGKPPKAAPRHNFSWFVWDQQWDKRPTQFWEGRKENETINIPNETADVHSGSKAA